MLCFISERLLVGVLPGWVRCRRPGAAAGGSSRPVAVAGGGRMLRCQQQHWRAPHPGSTLTLLLPDDTSQPRPDSRPQ